ncbi:MAG: GxxExxY protein [Saprospiraceae bacterium]
MNEKTYNELTSQIISACIEVHRELGPGLLESVYEVCLLDELYQRGLKAEAQVRLPVTYKGKQLNKEFIIDILVENLIVVELKTVDVLAPIHEVQLVTYLKLSDKKLGLLVNFNVELMKNGIRRKINGHLNE